MVPTSHALRAQHGLIALEQTTLLKGGYDYAPGGGAQGWPFGNAEFSESHVTGSLERWLRNVKTPEPEPPKSCEAPAMAWPGGSGM